ncbi:hypothetical protein [Altererythrobacter fulvus]|uniref:hypothetical protein n=1 Tax=Caenibius fulvus TaxID=2126012 RepID=UPI0030181AF2
MHYDPPMRFLALLPMTPALLLAGCGPNDTDPGPGGVTVAEARALDEAAQMIEQRRLQPEALEEPSATPAAPASTAVQSSPGE